MRCFFAVNIPDEIKVFIDKQIAPLKIKYPELKWIKHQNLHFTIKFLGEIDYRKISDIVHNTKLVIDFFNLKILNDISAFPSKNKGRVLWLNLAEDSRNKLKKLFFEVEKNIQQIGIAVDNKDFSPHLTIARSAREKQIPKSIWDENINFGNLEFKVKSIELMKSVLSPGGSIYSVLKSFPLEQGGK